MNDFANLYKDSTGVDARIWISSKYGRCKTPRIKVFSGNSSVVISIDEHPQILYRLGHFPENLLTDAFKWVSINRDTLIYYWNHPEFCTFTLLKCLKKLQTYALIGNLKINGNNTSMNHNYKIVEIKEFCQLHHYKDYTRWCIIFAEMAYDFYLDGGKRRLFILEQGGYKSLPKTKGKEYPYDHYGLSLLAVIINADGTLHSITSRWNSLDENEFSLGTNFLRSLIGRDVKQLFP